MTDKIVLVDMDGPLANFEAGFLNAWRQKFPTEYFIPLEQRREFYLIDEYPEKLKDSIESIRTRKDFILTLEPVVGSIEAINQMIGSGIRIFICSSEIYQNTDCLTEKKLWLKKHVGDELARTAIFTKDKTMVRGNYLIDDKPEIRGIYKPEWQQIVFNQPFNEKIISKPRIKTDWSNWKEVIIF